MRFSKYSLTLLLTVCALAAFEARGQEKGKHGADSSHQEMNTDAMNDRGDKVMGFDHEKTTHHFLLTNDGGVIQVEANDANDEASRDQIRKHLGHIAVMFSDGNFKAPMLIHAQTPPGVAEMKASKAKIEYEFVKTERGGRVVIKTNDPEALKAIHEFLRFQITEHKTGDPVVVS